MNIERQFENLSEGDYVIFKDSEGGEPTGYLSIAKITGKEKNERGYIVNVAHKIVKCFNLEWYMRHGFFIGTLNFGEKTSRNAQKGLKNEYF